MERSLSRRIPWLLEYFRAVIRYFSTDSRGMEADEETEEQIRRTAEQLLNDHGNSVLRLAYAYLHNLSDAEEVLQDTLLQYLRTTPAFESEEHGKAWLLRVAANLSKNRLRYQKTHETDQLDEQLAGERREDLTFVWEAVKSLPVRWREVVHLFYQEGYSTAQIARILHRNESTVRSDLRRARLRLKEILKEAYDFDGTI